MSGLLPDDDRPSARPEEWPWMPLEPRPLVELPPVGWWVWLIPQRLVTSAFHEVVAIEVLDEDDGPLSVVVARCHAAWPLDYLAAAVPPHHPTLALEDHGHKAACRNCSRHAGSRRTYWSRRLAE
jgi:hypothetical protein